MRERISGRFEYPKVAGITCGVGKVQQSFKKDCDVNEIMRKALRGSLVPVKMGTPQFGDFSSVGSYHEAALKLLEADKAFGMLPADVRERFNNDPGEFIGFLSDAKNKDEAIALGLVEKPAVVLAPVPAK